MAGMPPAGPPAMAAPTPVTEPAVQCSASDVPPPGTRLRVISGEPPLRLVSSANGATGRSTGTFTRATSDALSVATTEAGSSLPPGPDHEDVPDAVQEVGGGGNEAALGDGDADERHHAVGGGRLQLDHGAPSRLGGRRHGVLWAGQRREGVDGGVGRGAVGRALRRRGEQDDDPGGGGHDGADAHEHHDGAAVRVAPRGVEEHGRPPVLGRDLAGVAPQPVVGVDPPAQARFGAVRATRRRPTAAALVRARLAFLGLLGRVAHGSTLPRTAPKMPSGDGAAIP